MGMRDTDCHVLAISPVEMSSFPVCHMDEMTLTLVMVLECITVTKFLRKCTVSAKNK